MKSICYRGFLGGPRSMGKVGYYLVSHLLNRPRYRVYFYPWDNDYMAGYWGARIDQIVIQSTECLKIDQAISFCSVHDAKQDHFARLTTPWIFYELSTLPSKFRKKINSNDAVYVTSSFVQQVFLNHGVTVPITVLGHGFNSRHYHFRQRVKEREFTFLCVAENTPRKNLPTLVRCFERAFEKTPRVRLVIKLGLLGEGRLRRHIKQPSRVQLMTEEIEDDAGLNELYGSAHCFVLPTRAEGFGMPVLEAMATGLPVIVTNFGGHLDFCNDTNSFLIRNKGLVNSDPACFPYIESQWADPDEDHLIHLMRQVYADYEQALKVGKKAYTTVRTKWTWQQQLGQVFP